MKTILIALITTIGIGSYTMSDFFIETEQGGVKGVITDAETGDLVAFANVILTDANGIEKGAVADLNGAFEINKIPVGTYSLKVNMVGYDAYIQKKVKIEKGVTKTINIALENSSDDFEEVVVVQNEAKKDFSGSSNRGVRAKMASYAPNASYNTIPHNTESYSPISENGFKEVKASPLSTFAADVDAASYSNMRRFLMNGDLPQKDAIRVEELINYFEYDYENPEKDRPFSITTEIGDCPWNTKNKLVHIGLQGQRLDLKDLPPNNLVFLLDVSGSMGSPNKLPLLKKSLKMLLNELTDRDRVAIVVYAGAAGEVLPSTPASEKTKILAALENLNAGGSTAGGAGIKLAYDVAEKNFIKGGNNRVILATDGDFNIGVSSDGAMKDLIEEKRNTGVFLTCLGFGMGNYKDSKMETLANKGNGNYAYIDNLLEAKKVLVNEVGATLVTLAKDVKIQVEFNPAIVQSYRLVGYENRLLNAEDFNDDTKDAGEIGAGHSVTALYEIVLADGNSSSNVDDLRYQDQKEKGLTDEILTVKFRYKEPDGDVSKLIEKNLPNKIVSNSKLSENFKWSAAVASFGMILRDSEFKNDLTIDKIEKWAQDSRGKDVNGYRAEFIQLVKLTKSLM